MPDMAMPSSTLSAIICFQLWMKAVPIVIRPKATVMKENHSLGPNLRTAIVDGSWKVILAIVKMKMLTEYRFPTRSKSEIIEVTDAELITPESRRLSEQRMPAMVHNRRSTLRRRLLSRSLATCASSPCSTGSRGVVLLRRTFVVGAGGEAVELVVDASAIFDRGYQFLNQSRRSDRVSVIVETVTSCVDRT